MSEPTARPTPAPASPKVAEPAPYRPLSILAIVGLALAAAYVAAVVLIGGFDLLHGEPLQLHLFWSLLPVGGVVASVLALMRIKRSEGTLAGEKAARWGLLLSVLVGLSYWAYVGATWYAISREASQFCENFLGKLSHGEAPAAFRLTLPAGERPAEDDRLREQLEGRYNNVSERGTKGPFGMFRQAEAYRMLSLGGPTTTFEPLGVDSWEYTAGGYEVRLIYQVRQPQASYTMVVTLLGSEAAKGSGASGRQWHVDWGKTGLKAGVAPQITEDGRALFNATEAGRLFIMNDWLEAMRKGRTEDVFLATLPAEQREPARKSAEQGRLSLLLADGLGTGALPWAGPAAALSRVMMIGDPDVVREATFPGFAAFAAGGLIRVEKGVFWAPADISEEIVRQAREQFRHPTAQMAQVLIPEMAARFPVLKREGNRLLVGTDVSMPVPVAAPRYVVEGRLTVECDADEAAAGRIKTWRVHSFELDSGKPLPPPRPDMRPSPAGPGT
jgi:hypothetical protein